MLLFIMMYLTNPFYTLMYFFITTLLLGLLIAYYNLEFFTGFLYVLEVTVVFIMLILFFFFNFKSSNSSQKNEYTFLWPVFLSAIFIMPTFYSEEENMLPDMFRTHNLWDDYYQAINQSVMNDFAGLFISYYLIHSLEFIIIGFILFIGSVGCITLYSILGFSKRVTYNLLINFISSFNKIYNILFMRKQNMIYQAHTKDSIRYSERKHGFISPEEEPINSQAKELKGNNHSDEQAPSYRTIKKTKGMHRSKRDYSAYDNSTTKLSDLDSSFKANTPYYKYTYKKN